MYLYKDLLGKIDYDVLKSIEIYCKLQNMKFIW